MLDLLDAGTSRRLVRAAGAARSLADPDDDGSDFAEGEGGRLIIKDDAPQVPPPSPHSPFQPLFRGQLVQILADLVDDYLVVVDCPKKGGALR
jgi:hypothetical protein